ncbi:MAG: hypothetical protein EOM20_16215 [Spartobacteria bacterium]|nr:hypothetical protein [Spartobacteria bacterium]
MKKMVTNISIFLCALCACAGTLDTHVVTLWTSNAVTSNAYSRVIDVNDYKPESGYALQLHVSDTGVLTRCVYELSNDGVYFMREQDSSVICSNWQATSGAYTNGFGMFKFTPAPTRYMRFRVEATGGTARTTSILSIR